MYMYIYECICVDMYVNVKVCANAYIYKVHNVNM